MSHVTAKTLKEGTDFEKKHVPMIECKDTVKPNEIYEVKIHTAGVEHPMEDGHFIQFIELNVEEYPLLRVQLTQYAKPDVVVNVKAPNEEHVGRTLKLVAYMFCNLHGPWKYEKEVKIQ
ncbi:Desulfoferrodoxin ferrous iron-binding region [Methanococcus vannielii SB]|uniref:Desulfoferrodoxin ferrous iron-binding region n=1 Tax=Methanococcus vannielii (strain ATCC 35089 / DSM 1224 / JCM 13029 / OCM 148 / SB) TaxID=406327 RepID=A6UPG2_METVS|nr:class II SORL domain-containing protein [Methanococcus vannielii]ABR54384.1 Desulfoferrodoxin ferrous iron-binding region [Methanococcus vannielii SB]